MDSIVTRRCLSGIADFGHSTAPPAPERRSLARPDALQYWPSIDSRSLAPECYDCTFLQASDVVAFGLIRFAILSARPAFPESLHQHQIAFQVSVKGKRPEIPNSVFPGVRSLIEDCWDAVPDDRPTFEGIVYRLAGMDFKVTADVNSAKVWRFVKRIEDWEARRRND
jgi:hypothetical protein